MSPPSADQPGRARVTPFTDLRYSATAALFEGGDEAPLSVFVTRYERGQGPRLHLHPYPEVFVVETGLASFIVGDDELTVAGGNVVIAPAQTPHAFKSIGDETLRVIGIHPSAQVEQTDLTDQRG